MLSHEISKDQNNAPAASIEEPSRETGTDQQKTAAEASRETGKDLDAPMPGLAAQMSPTMRLVAEPGCKEIGFRQISLKSNIFYHK